MEKQFLISVVHLCENYNIQLSFITDLNEMGLVEIISIEEEYFIHEEKISEIEKMIRIHQDLNLNKEAIDVVFNLLNKINLLEEELKTLQNRICIYEQ